MEDATETRYWCHMCSRSVNPVIEGEIVKCNLCQGGFVEEMDNAPDSVTMMNDHDHHTRDEGDDDQNNDGEIDLDGQLQEIMRRRGRHSAAILGLLQEIRAGLSVQDTSSVPPGSLGDYFIGPGFEMLLQRLAENDPNNRYGTPPATKEAVEALGTVIIEESFKCTVCLDDFETGTEAKEMPCKHKFHSGCLLPWLELHSSCPLCRYLLPTADDDKAHTETSRNVDDISIASVESNGSSLESSSNN